jgi:hypothetical protein
MQAKSDSRSIVKIASIIHHRPLSQGLVNSITYALSSPFTHLVGQKNAWDIFKHSLDSAIRDIENHPRGLLFRRLIEYGPHHPDDSESVESDGQTVLSDPECGECVEFIFSHMINRFKGELAEILAIEPCINFVSQLKSESVLSGDVNIYWGEAIQERRRVDKKDGDVSFGGFTKGADGLLVQRIKNAKGKHDSLMVHGIVEIKSMLRSKKKIGEQIDLHKSRLKGGIRLGDQEWEGEQIMFPGRSEGRGSRQPFVRIMVIPSRWKLSREWKFEYRDGSKFMVFPEPGKPQVDTEVEKLEKDLWKITLNWSQDVLNQAAYEMTYWYMSQVGTHIYSKKPLPKGWEGMSPEEAGYNAIKMMLYYMPLRYLSVRQYRLAIRLYNVYSFGYPLGVDSREMLWPEDFKE